MTDEITLADQILKLMYNQGCAGFWIQEDLEELRNELMSILNNYKVEKLNNDQ